MSSVVTRVKSQRDAEFGPLLTTSMGGIHRPTDLQAHAEERCAGSDNCICLIAVGVLMHI